MAKRPTPPLIEIDRWFVTTVLPRRTTVAGFSGNRLWKTPRDLLTGNRDDPNGLCGDCAAFVTKVFDDTFHYRDTPDGYQLGLLLWNGTVLNHIANVMMPTAKVVRQKFVTVGSATTNLSGDNAWKHANKIKSIQARDLITGPEVLGLRVYDLYYKMQPTTLGEWWKDRDGGMNGTVEVGPESDFA